MYFYESRVGFSESDDTGKLTLLGLLNYFQDAATFHSEDLGVGWDYVKERNLFWVLSSWQIVVYRYPKTCEKIEIGTAPYAFKGCFGYRNFLMRTKSGEILAVANSLWTLLSTTERIGRMTDKMKEVYVVEPKLDMEYAERRIAIPEGGKNSEAFEIGKHHLDSNKHVNNGKYVEMAMQEITEHAEISQVRVEYKKQAFLGDRIIPYVAERENGAIVAIRGTDGEDFAVVDFSWK